MHKKRLLAVAFILMAASVYLVAVQLRICFVKGEEYTVSAVSQRACSLVVKRYRGKILDRNGEPLVERDVFVRDGHALPSRYGDTSPASHLVGYVDGDGAGVCGLEKRFEDVLAAKSVGTLRVLRSGDGQIIDYFGSELRRGEYLSDNVVTTLDYDIQTIAEEALKGCGNAGAVVVMDVESFDVLAMASSPDYDRNRVEDYLDSQGGELINRCLAPYNAGSIFKPVTLCAALEKGRVRDVYHCTGTTEVSGRSFVCHETKGHGPVDLEAALAKSCNCAFYTMSMDLGADDIIAMAGRFGLGNCVLEGDFPEESPGNIPQGGQWGLAGTLNIAIGQGDILITPLQAANMVCIIANDGLSKKVNILKGIESADGTCVRELCVQGKSQVVSAHVARRVGQAMEKAVTMGTASSLETPGFSVAGKTGTAETGWQKEGRAMVHGWFCGYFPADKPRYAMAVLVEDGGSGAGSALPVFENIAVAIQGK